MSAVDAYVLEDRACVFTDGSVYNVENTLLKVDARKCIDVPGKHSVVTGRGPSELPTLFAKWFAESTMELDEFATDSEAFIDEFLDELSFGNAGRPYLDLWIAGWLWDEKRPVIFQYSNAAPEGVERFSVVDSIQAPEINESEFPAIHAAVGRVDSLAEMDPKIFRIASMEAQRRTRGEAPIWCGRRVFRRRSRGDDHHHLLKDHTRGHSPMARPGWQEDPAHVSGRPVGRRHGSGRTSTDGEDGAWVATTGCVRCEETAA